MESFKQIMVGKLYQNLQDGKITTCINVQPNEKEDQICIFQEYSWTREKDCIIFNKEMIDDLIDMLMSAKSICHE